MLVPQREFFLTRGDLGGALGGEPREDGGVHRAAILVDDWEGGPGVLGHGDTVPEGDTMKPAPRVVARLVTNVP